jgi:hypothetical protein
MKMAFAIALAVLAASNVSSTAQVYPSRPVTLIVPFSAGGPTDTIGRIFAERISASLGQTVIVENVTGAAGSIVKVYFLVDGLFRGRQGMSAGGGTNGPCLLPACGRAGVAPRSSYLNRRFLRES